MNIPNLCKNVHLIYTLHTNFWLSTVYRTSVALKKCMITVLAVFYGK